MMKNTSDIKLVIRAIEAIIFMIFMFNSLQKLKLTAN